MARLVKVCILGNNEAMIAMRRATRFANVRIVETMAEADLVIAEDVRNIEANFSKDKHYAIVTVEKVRSALPENVVVFRAPFELTDYYNFISKIVGKLADVEEEIIPETPLRPDAKCILVVDDTPQNIISAKKLLAGHKLTVAEGYEQAMKMLGEKKFEVVLTDLYLPMSSRLLSNKAFKMGELVPYGFLLMCEAARNGANYIAVVTDLGRHDDHFSAAFDHFSRFSFKIENAKVKMLHCKRTEDGAKDWENALERILKD